MEPQNMSNKYIILQRSVYGTNEDLAKQEKLFLPPGNHLSPKGMSGLPTFGIIEFIKEK